MDSTNPVHNAYLHAENDPVQIRQFLNALSGAIHSSSLAALIQDSRLIRNAANDRLRTARGTGPVLWSHGFGVWGTNNPQANAAQLNRETTGFVMGSDAPVGPWRLGALAGYSRSIFRIKARISSGNSENYHLGAYASYQAGPLSLRTGVAYSWHEIHTQRTVELPGLINKLNATYQATTLQAFGELSLKLAAKKLSIEPFVNLAFVQATNRGLQESGGASALYADRSTMSTAYATLGLRAQQNFEFAHGTKGNLYAMAGWQRAWGDNSAVLAQHMAGGQPFSISGAPIARQNAVLEVGLQLQLRPSTLLYLSWQGLFASGTQEQNIKAMLAVHF